MHMPLRWTDALWFHKDTQDTTGDRDRGGFSDCELRADTITTARPLFRNTSLVLIGFQEQKALKGSGKCNNSKMSQNTTVIIQRFL